jgi:hypothetical protein
MGPRGRRLRMPNLASRAIDHETRPWRNGALSASRESFDLESVT